MIDKIHKIVYVPIEKLIPSDYNPRKASQKQLDDLKESIKRFGFPDPIIVNSASKRKNIIIGGHMRHKVASELGLKELPVVYVNIPDIKKEQELNIRLNKNSGEFDFNMLANIDEDLLKDIGFDLSEMTIITGIEEPNEKEIDLLETKNECPKCGYKW